ncbi:hypothetical protein MKC91_13970 [[Clostridium] innocuum]|nr:hypothetical protein [Erysipelotrichaceae bacterium]MCR0381853.1 hypothetical protein [[Clostridium] innocuum]MCR0414294.1 hypothetical protein [[Clostridium] innocuum]MCR0535270.1 hypothetical protein [[Clostridium] innocuum]MCR0539506.1 hypothetical protein [[Clostridium] innocuum]
MKKYFQFKKEEKAVLAIGMLVIVVVLAAGLLKQKFVKAEVYVPLTEEQQSVNAIAAKKETFVIEQNAKLSQKAETYVNADSDALKKVQLDLSAVDVTAPGSYQAFASLQKERVSFVIKVVDSAKPVMQVAHADFQFVIESNSTMQEVREYAGVTAVDASGNDLSASITGWDEELPAEAKTVTYQLSVKDAQGQSAKRSVRVQYLLPKEEKKD